MKDTKKKTRVQQITRPINRRTFLGTMAMAGTALYSLGTVNAWAKSSTGNANKSDSSKRPSYYPDDYDSIIAGSKKEQQITIYSNMAEYNWKPIIEGFQAQYPWIKKISTNNLGSSEVFQRYYSESASGKSPASLLVSGDPLSWIDFQGHHQAALHYKSPELGHLPDFGQPLPNVYTFSADPILMGFNKLLLQENERPTSMKKLAELINSNSEKFKNKVTTYDVEVGFGFSINRAWLDAKPDGWDLLDKILPMTRPEQSSGPMVNKINTGEYLAGFFMSSTVVLPQVEQAGQVLGWSYIADGTPMFLRGMSIPKTAPEPNTAKLLLDYLLSYSGQKAVFEGGFTPYRKDLDPKDVPRSFQTVVDKVGKDNVIIIDYKKMPEQEQKQIRTRWQQALQKRS